MGGESTVGFFSWRSQAQQTWNPFHNNASFFNLHRIFPDPHRIDPSAASSGRVQGSFYGQG